MKRGNTLPQAISLGPSTLVLLCLLPVILYFFWQSSSYQEALNYIVPGIKATLLVTLFGYLFAALLGLGLAGLLLLRSTSHTVRNFALTAGLFALLSGVFFSRPAERYALAGSTEGRVAILRSTPARASDPVQAGSYGGEALRVRSADNVEDALSDLRDGDVSAVFIPQDALPKGLPILWQHTFLAPRYFNLAVLCAVVAALLGLLCFAAYSSGEHPLRIFAELYIDMIRGIPMLVIILYVGFPLQGALRDATGGFLDLPILLRGTVAIAFGYAAYLAEIFRAGLEAVPQGQREAARSLGLSSQQTFRRVVLPQAVRIVTPPLGNEFIAMLKDSSLLSVLGVRELTQLTREYQSNTFQLFPAFNTVALLYIIVTLMASSLLKWLERRTKYSR